MQPCTHLNSSSHLLSCGFTMLNFWWCSCCSSSGKAIPVSGEARTTRDRIATPFVKDTCDIIWYCLRMLRLMSLLWRWRWHGHQALKESLFPLPMKPEKPCWINFQDLLNPPLTQTSANHHPSMICVFVRTTALMIVQESSSMMMSVQRHSRSEIEDVFN